ARATGAMLLRERPPRHVALEGRGAGPRHSHSRLPQRVTTGELADRRGSTATSRARQVRTNSGAGTTGTNCRCDRPALRRRVAAAPQNSRCIAVSGGAPPSHALVAPSRSVAIAGPRHLEDPVSALERRGCPRLDLD